MLAALLLSSPLLASQAALSKSDLENWNTAALAQHFLPASEAARVVSHELRDKPLILASDAPAYDAIQFFLRPSPAGKGVCRRDTRYVKLNKPSFKDDLYQFENPALRGQVQLAINDDCDQVPDSAFGWLRSARDEEVAATMLQQLTTIQNQARQHGRLLLPVECKSLLSHSDPCQAGTLQVVRDLPLDRIFIIESDRKSRENAPIWQLSIMPTGPGQAYFHTRLIPVGDAWRLQLTWQAPAPF